MPTNFPGSVDSFPRPSSSTNTDDPGFELDVVIDNLSDALEAVETRVLSGVIATWGRFVTPPMVNRYFFAAGTVDGDQPPAANTAGTYWYPIINTRPVTLSEAGTYCWAADATASIRVALYNADAATLAPTTRIVDLGTLSAASTGFKTMTLTQDIPAVCVVAIYVPTSATAKWSKSAPNPAGGPHGPNGIADGMLGPMKSYVDYSAGFPSTAPSVTVERWSINQTAPHIHLKVGALL